MSILIDHETRVCLQGITGPMGRFQAEEMRRYGTRLVAGVGPGRGGQTAARASSRGIRRWANDPLRGAGERR